MPLRSAHGIRGTVASRKCHVASATGSSSMDIELKNSSLLEFHDMDAARPLITAHDCSVHDGTTANSATRPLHTDYHGAVITHATKSPPSLTALRVRPVRVTYLSVSLYRGTHARAPRSSRSAPRSSSPTAIVKCPLKESPTSALLLSIDHQLQVRAVANSIHLNWTR